ncbi:MAG TPA: hypothetical protein VHB78_04365 [Vicinamibacterales bacterium]|jgi:hypothetical protein|nr:hypothetical protein [Vicinamibacterales bacterium]
MKKDQSSQSTNTGKDRGVNRRRFLSGVAIGAGLAPLATLSNSLWARRGASAASALCVGAASLAPTDLAYLGKVLLPEDDPASGTRFGYSMGALAGRRVGGELRLFITGASGQASGGDYRKIGDAVYEVRPGAIGARATLVRNWGDVTQGRTLRRDMNQGYEIRGLQYLNGQLYWAYGSQYFSGSDPDPSIGMSTLNDSTGAVQAYGPWRTTEHSQKTRGYLVPVPPDFTPAGGRLLAVGAPPTSGNNYGPRGANLFALDPITTSKSADSASNTNASLSGKRLIYHDSAHPQARDGNYSICGWNVNYDNSKGGYLTPGSPDFNNSDYQRSNESRALDALSAAAWVRTSSREGIVFFGQLYYGHMWYGPGGFTPCVHGKVASISTGTGPQAETAVPVICIYSPSAVAAQSNPWDAPASALVPLSTIVPSFTSVAVPYQFGGAWFDSTDNRLYLSDVAGENLGEPRTVIHVFSVKA